MGGKTLLLLGLIIMALFMYICIDTKKDALYAELVENNESNTLSAVDTPKEVEKKVEKPIVAIKVKKSPSFAYISGAKEKIAAFLSDEDKESNITSSIEEICQKENCVKEIQYFKDVAPFTFSKEVTGLIQSAKTEEIKDFSLFLNNKSLKIEGKLKKVEQEEIIKPFMEAFLAAGYTIENEMHLDVLLPSVKAEPALREKPMKAAIIKEEIVTEAPRDIFVTPQHLSIDEAAENINSLISSNNITFEYRSSDISKDSKETLNQVIDILLGLDDVNIEVAGYTDSKGDTIYNKVLSQKRADAVQTYLIKSGIRAKLLKSKGYGEENPISSPEDIINRRVEIHLRKGE